MKSTIIVATVYLLFVVVCAVAKKSSDYLPVKDLLPLPLVILQDEKHSNKYKLESLWHGNAYDDDEKVKAEVKCGRGVVVKNSPQVKKFGERKAVFELIVPQNQTM
ncbi:5680_t:CDS:2, partial [Acaulospora morrowiae]